MVVSVVLFVSLFVCVRAFSFENVYEDVSRDTIIHHESCHFYLTHRHEYLRQYLWYELFLYWFIQIIVGNKVLTHDLKIIYNLLLQEKNIKKEKKEKKIKELI